MAQEDLNTAKALLIEYLASTNSRVIPKRFLILEQVYAFDSFFTVDSLYQFILSNNLKVSRATVYNTVDLLVEAKILRKNFFNGGLTLYERISSKKVHPHYNVCERCGKIRHFNDESIRTAIMTKRVAKFKQNSYVLQIYGLCSSCMKEDLEK
jgi:Fur family ferric uptake transcriptional regulator